MLNHTLLRTRRQEIHLSQRALAKQLGVTSVVIASLEAGDNHDTVTLGFLHKLCEALGVHERDLFDSDTPADRSDLSAECGALLAHTETLTPIDTLSQATNATLDEVEEALRTLGSHLAPAGLALQRRDNAVAIRPSVLVDRDALKTALRTHQARNGINITEARVLARALRGELDEGKLGNADQVALGRLRNAGVLSGDTRPGVEDDVRASLTLPL